MNAIVTDVVRALRAAERVAAGLPAGSAEHERAVKAVRELEAVFERLTGLRPSGDAFTQAMREVDPKGSGPARA
jgi:hypothetical protein